MLCLLCIYYGSEYIMLCVRYIGRESTGASKDYVYILCMLYIYKVRLVLKGITQCIFFLPLYYLIPTTEIHELTIVVLVGTIH